MKLTRLLALFALSILAGIALTSCATAPPRSVAELDAMSAVDFASVEQEIVQSVRIEVGVALDQGWIDEDDQVLIASMIETIARGEFEPVPDGPISAALEDAGFTGNEVLAVFGLAEILMRRNGVDFGAALSPRASQLMLSIAGAVVSVSKSAPKGGS